MIFSQWDYILPRRRVIDGCDETRINWFIVTFRILSSMTKKHLKKLQWRATGQILRLLSCLCWRGLLIAANFCVRSNRDEIRPEELQSRFCNRCKRDALTRMNERLRIKPKKKKCGEKKRRYTQLLTILCLRIVWHICAMYLINI